MEEKTVSATLRKSFQSSKEFAVKRYHSLADLVNKTYTAHKEKGRNEILKMAFAKYVLVFLDILYLVTSLAMINIGTIGQILNMKFYWWYEVQCLSIFWVTTGFILLFASIFGLIGAFKESHIWTNIFGILMILVFLTQITSAIYAFQFIGKSDGIARRTIDTLMGMYSDGRTEMDWIQRYYQCCGNDRPTDWNRTPQFHQSRRDTIRDKTDRFDYYSTSTTTTLPTPFKDRMPASCCVGTSNYNNLTCDKYFEDGCLYNFRETISATVMIIGSVALAIAVLEILGIVFAFVAARIMRRTKSSISIQKFDKIDNLPVNNEESATAGADVGTI